MANLPRANPSRGPRSRPAEPGGIRAGHDPFAGGKALPGQHGPGLVDRVRAIAGTSLPGHCPGPRAFGEDDPPSPPPDPGGLSGYLLAWTAPLSFCGGLVGLAVLPALEVTVPRGAILGYGVGCALLALLALLLSRPRPGDPAGARAEYVDLGHPPSRAGRAPEEDRAMFALDLTKLTPEQRAMVDLWEAHLRAEFQDRDARASCDTMVARPYVNHVPVLTGGVGRPQLEHFYGKYFIPGQPPDVELVPISRTVGQGRVVDEFVFRCTHTVRMDWLVPGVEPTGRRLELVMVVVVSFEGGKVHHEHIHWDQASALVQLGLLDPAGLPVAGAETARKALDPTSVPSNLLMKRAIPDELL
jgi:carboxymethylenebutenolidase